LSCPFSVCFWIINLRFPRSSTGIFFILPCIDAYARVDLRTRTYDVPPQEVSCDHNRGMRARGLRYWKLPRILKSRKTGYLCTCES
jgi:regulator of protease activity HflC (stomatin/prohibitin superfamily)